MQVLVMIVSCQRLALKAQRQPLTAESITFPTSQMVGFCA